MKLAFIWFLSSTKEPKSHVFMSTNNTTAEVQPILQQKYQTLYQHMT